jgi:hypothetical protein
VTLLVGLLRASGGTGGGLTFLVYCHHREKAAIAVAYLLGLDVLSNNFDAGLARPSKTARIDDSFLSAKL